jgi:hypothetical protein
MRKQSQYHLLKKRDLSSCSGEHEDLSINSKEEKLEEGDDECTAGQELGRRADMDTHEGGSSAGASVTGELVQCLEQRGPGLGHHPPHGHVCIGSRTTA